MPNDDLGTFPMPPQTASAPVDEPVVPDDQPSLTTPVTPPTSASLTEPNEMDTISTNQPPIQTEPNIPPVAPTAPTNVFSTPDEAAPTTTAQVPQTPSAFEETPDEIPSITSPVQAENTYTPEVPSLAPPTAFEDSPQDQLVQANEDLIEKQTSPEIVLPQPAPEPIPATPAPAVLPPKSGGSLAPVIIVVLLIIAGIGLAAAAYLSAQTNKLKTQLSQITQTLQEQQTTLTPTVTPTVFEIPTPTTNTTPTATQGATITPTLTPTVVFTNALLPLKNAPSALQIAINHSPNAQLILIKVDNATDPATAVTKYFFRQDLTTKKYFYVAITGTGTPQVVDNQIYVTPDDNIPSLNDAILSNNLGIDLSDAIAIALAQCANQTVCTAAQTKAQYIKTGTGIIWQLSLYTKGLTANPLTIQINATTKAILYKSPEFANI